MSTHNKKSCLVFGLAAAGLLISNSIHAGTPLWTYSAPTPARVMITDGGTANAQYTVTNQSSKAKNLVLQATPGISASSCYLERKGSSCTLTLTITGSLIAKEDIQTGPVLCEQGNPNQCYQPAAGNLLNITRSSSPPLTDGHLELSQYGLPVSQLALSPGGNGTLLLKNTGELNVSTLSIQFPFGWQSYFTNSCPAILAPQQSCSIVYAIPTPSAVGILNPLTIQGTGADNTLTIPVSIQALGSVMCWGFNFYGQLGNGANGVAANRSTPVAVNNISNALAITGGYYHACALLTTGKVNCWGWNLYGQLGNGASGTGTNSNIPVEVLSLNNALTITAGFYHTCALLKTGVVNCWGENNNGQLGNGTNTDSNTPVAVLSIDNAVAMTAGSAHTCVLLKTGEVKCWGENNNGQLGNGSTINSSTPVAVLSINNAVAITGGEFHTCALLETGAVNCWGLNTSGQLGNGNTINSSTPVTVNSINNAVAITAGANHTCTLLATGLVNCWGNNSDGQLGNGTSGTVNNSSTPVAVNSINNALAITGGNTHNCALLGTGEVNCWGYNAFGQLGNSNNTNSSSPVTTCSGAGCPADLSALGLFNHNLGSSSCAIIANP